MQAKKETLRMKDAVGTEYAVYPKTLLECIVDENGNPVVDIPVGGINVSNTIDFAEDGTITKVYEDGRKEVTTEQADGTLITKYYTDDVLTETKTVTEDANGNISVTYVKEGE